MQLHTEWNVIVYILRDIDAYAGGKGGDGDRTVFIPLYFVLHIKFFLIYILFGEYLVFIPSPFKVLFPESLQTKKKIGYQINFWNACRRYMLACSIVSVVKSSSFLWLLYAIVVYPFGRFLIVMEGK